MFKSIIPNIVHRTATIVAVAESNDGVQKRQHEDDGEILGFVV